MLQHWGAPANYWLLVSQFQALLNSLRCPWGRHPLRKASIHWCQKWPMSKMALATWNFTQQNQGEYRVWAASFHLILDLEPHAHSPFSFICSALTREEHLIRLSYMHGRCGSLEHIQTSRCCNIFLTGSSGPYLQSVLVNSPENVCRRTVSAIISVSIKFPWMRLN